MWTERYELKELLYENALSNERDVKDFRMEGEVTLSFPRDCMRMENKLGDGTYVLWCPEEFPDNIAISWDFQPIYEPGLSILFFSATGRNGEDIFDPQLSPRNGVYGQYHSGDINAYHVSYFRRKNDRRLQTCNLRKSHGFHLVAQGCDPLPSIPDIKDSYRVQLIKCGREMEFIISDLTSFCWTDDGTVGGSFHSKGKIGFRQMAPLIAEYGNLKVHRVERK